MKRILLVDENIKKALMIELREKRRTGIIIETTVLSIGVCLLATCIPLRKISRMSIVDSIGAVE